MDEDIDFMSVIHQLQLENEMLRRSAGVMSQVTETITRVPNFVETLYHRAMSNKYGVLIAVMILYWVGATIFMVHDHFRGI
jgi:hypothetical protein